jgi:cysteine dioxygenase
MSDISNLQDLIKNLQAHRFDDRKFIGELLQKTNLDVQAIEKRCIWSKKKYVRNLVHRGEVFEVLILCWDVGHNSPIHDHSGSSCWMKILQGSATEEIYNYNLENRSFKNIDLEQSRELNAGEFVYIDDEAGVHRVINSGESKLITLHIYAKPIGECLRYIAKENKTEPASFANDIQLDISNL